MPRTYTTVEGRRVNLDRLNEARWATCNTAVSEAIIAAGWSMEDAAAMADAAVRGYLGIQPYEWAEMVATIDA